MQNWRIKTSLFLNYFVFAMLLNSVGTVIMQVQRNFGINETSASVLEAFKDMSVAITSFLVASFVVRVGYKKTMLLGLAFVTIVCAIIPSLSSFAMTKILFATVGASFALIKVSVMATIGLVTKDNKEHTSFMSFLESFFMVGVLAGNLVFAAFVDDLNPSSVKWFNVYYLLAGIAAFAFVLLLSSPLDESVVKKELPKSPADDVVEMIRLFMVPAVLVFIVSAFFYVLIEQSIGSWLPTFNKDILKMKPSLAIQMASIMAGAIALGRFLSGIFLRKFKWFTVLSFSLLGAASVVLLMPQLLKSVTGIAVTSVWHAPVVAFVFPLIGFFLAPIYPAINSVILTTLPKRMHAPMGGLIVIFSALGGSTGSIITGFMFQHYGGQTAFMFSLLPICILMIALFLLMRFQKKAIETTDSTLQPTL